MGEEAREREVEPDGETPRQWDELKEVEKRKQGKARGDAVVHRMG